MHGIISVSNVSLTSIYDIFLRDLMDCCVKSSSAHPNNSQLSIKLWTLWWPIHTWKWCFMLLEPLFKRLNLNDPGTVIMEPAQAIRKEKNLLVEKSGHWLHSGCQLTSMFWAFNIAERRTWLNEATLDHNTNSTSLFSRNRGWWVLLFITTTLHDL